MQVTARTVLAFAANKRCVRVVFPPPEGAEMISNNPDLFGAAMQLLDVLHLLPELFQFSLQRHDFPRDDAVARL